MTDHGPNPGRVTGGKGVVFCGVSITQKSSGLRTYGTRGRPSTPHGCAQTNQVGLPPPAERNSRGPGRDPRQERRLWRVPARTRSARPDFGSRVPLSRRWRILTIKERASACPGGIASAGRSWTAGRGGCRRCRPLRGARATPKMPAGSPGPGARPHGPCPGAAPPLPSRVAWSWSVLGKLALRRGGRAQEAGWEWGSAFLRGSRGRAKARAPAVPKLRARPGGRRVPSSGRTGRASASGPWRAQRLPPRPGRTHWWLELGPGPGLRCTHRPPQRLGAFVRGARRPPRPALDAAAAAAASPSSSAAARSPPSRPARRLQLKADPAELIPEGH